MFPRYCGDLFGNDKRIIDFMHLSDEKPEEMAERCEWQEVPEVRLKEDADRRDRRGRPSPIPA